MPRSSSQALSAALMPYVLQLADQGCKSTAALSAGINIQSGNIIHPALVSLAA